MRHKATDNSSTPVQILFLNSFVASDVDPHWLWIRISILHADPAVTLMSVKS